MKGVGCTENSTQWLKKGSRQVDCPDKSDWLRQKEGILNRM